MVPKEPMTKKMLSIIFFIIQALHPVERLTLELLKCWLQLISCFLHGCRPLYKRLVPQQPAPLLSIEMANYKDLPTELVEIVFQHVAVDDIKSYSLVDNYHKAIGDRVMHRRYARAYQTLTFSSPETIMAFLHKLNTNRRIALHVRSLVYTGDLHAMDFLDSHTIFSHEDLSGYLERMSTRWHVKIRSYSSDAVSQEFAFCALLTHCHSLTHLGVSAIKANTLIAKVFNDLSKAGNLAYPRREQPAQHLERIDFGENALHADVKLPGKIQHIAIWPSLPRNVGILALREMKGAYFDLKPKLKIAEHDRRVVMFAGRPREQTAYTKIRQLDIHSEAMIPYFGPRFEDTDLQGLDTLILQVEHDGISGDDHEDGGMYWDYLLERFLHQILQVKHLRIGGYISTPYSDGLKRLRSLANHSALEVLDIDERFLNPAWNLCALDHMPQSLQVLKIKYMTEEGAKTILTNERVANMKERYHRLCKLIISTGDKEAEGFMREVADDLNVQFLVYSTKAKWMPGYELTQVIKNGGEETRLVLRP